MRKKKWGRFVGIWSKLAALALPVMSHFIAAKMGIIGFMGGLANDVADNGIPGDMVLPGPANILSIVASIGRAKTRHLRTAGHQGLGKPEDITGAILFVTSDDAAFIARQAIVVDGGQYSIG